jgi:translation initiation factor 3 subunit H
MYIHYLFPTKLKENTARKLAGEEPLPEDDPNFKLTPEPNRLDSLLLTNQINNYCRQIKQFSGSSFAKLWLVGGVNKDN